MLNERARLLHQLETMTDPLSLWWPVAWLAGALIAMVVSIPSF